MSGEYFVLILIFLAVVIPVVFGIGQNMFSRWLKLKEKQLDLAAHMAAEKAAAQAAHVERLEQRMRVLERIATDKGAALADEIGSLPARTAREIEQLRHHP